MKTAMPGRAQPGRSGPTRPAAPAGQGRRRWIVRGFAALGLLALAFHVAHGELGLGGHALDRFTDDWLYDAIVVGAAVACFARGLLVRGERVAWLLIGVGIAFDAAGEIYYSLAFGESGTPPIPSIADALYLLYYPFSYAGLVLLVRARVDRVRPSMWLDGAIAATTSAALITALAFDAIMRGAAHESLLAIATTLAYPVGDLILLAIAVGSMALVGWRPGRAWLLLVMGLVTWAVADTTFAAQSADGTYAVGGLLDTLWITAAFVVGVAAWQRPPAVASIQLKTGRLMAMPALFAGIALGLLLYGGLNHIHPLALLLAGVTVLLVIARAVWTFRENVQLLETSQHDAVTDALTGLGNRRQMNLELAAALADGPDSARAVLLMFDLDGFKLYNDEFGHMAGDTMLAHLGHRLQQAVVGVGQAYRLGGDEFCVLLRCEPGDADVHVAAVVEALTSSGEGFSVGASHGLVEIPAEAESPALALRLADHRMYAKKGSRRGSAREQTHNVLLGLLKEREPDLHDHLCHVGELAADVARKLGLEKDQVDDIRRGAELHDIGKAAVPDAILNKPGPLNEHEWAFMRRHTYVGERILAAAPSLSGVASLVRSSHERWDGKGYPDGLIGDSIPFGARIIAVCDAFDAMTSNRPYATARPADLAIAELRRVAGTQFDPDVVEAFVLAWHERDQRRGDEDVVEAAA